MMVLYGAARRSRVRRIVLLAHTFGYAVLLGVASGAWSFVLLFLWDGLGIVLRFFLRSR